VSSVQPAQTNEKTAHLVVNSSSPFQNSVVWSSQW